MYFDLTRNARNWTFYSIKILKCESSLIAFVEILKSEPFYWVKL